MARERSKFRLGAEAETEADEELGESHADASPLVKEYETEPGGPEGPEEETKTDAVIDEPVPDSGNDVPTGEGGAYIALPGGKRRRVS